MQKERSPTWWQFDDILQIDSRIEAGLCLLVQRISQRARLELLFRPECLQRAKYRIIVTILLPSVALKSKFFKQVYLTTSNYKQIIAIIEMPKQEFQFVSYLKRENFRLNIQEAIRAVKAKNKRVA